MYKLCPKCGLNLPLESFYKGSQRKYGVQRICKECSKARRREMYANSNKELNRQIFKEQKEQNADVVYTYLKHNPCIDCGEKDPLVLDFDHQHSKDVNLATMIKQRFSLLRIFREIEKCVVRCANCHRRKTAKEDNHYRYRFVEKDKGTDPFFYFEMSNWILGIGE